MSAFDLTTLANVKAWLGLASAPSTSDATLTGLVTAASRAVQATLSRPGLLPQSYVETLDAERSRVFLRHWPVLGVSAVTLDGVAVRAAAPISAAPILGYRLQPGEAAPPGRPQALDLYGERLWRPRQNLVVAYSAGYAVQGEAQSVPGSAPYALTAIAPYGGWASDYGVAYAATGLALAPVTGAPAVGQYTVAAGVYTFNPGDAGAALSLAYGYIPQDLAQAATELAAERFRASERIGVSAKSLGGQETVAYDLHAVSAPVMALIQPYRRTAF